MNLYQEYQKAFEGAPWHGKSSLEIIRASDPEKVFVHWIPNAHSIAEIVAHLTVWTEEALDRLDGQAAKIPGRGDWPEVEKRDHWAVIINEFEAAQRNLLERIKDFTSADWESMVIDTREDSEGSNTSNGELVNGIIQHLAYHSGQISLLQKF